MSIKTEKCAFKVCYYSSQETGYSAEELCNHSPKSVGWTSLKFCEYPQEIGLQVLNDESDPDAAPLATRYMTQVQILSHEWKIASRIELYLGRGRTYQDADFERLGFMTLDGNERSKFQARELKTVYVDEKECNYMRFIIHRPHHNTKNLFQQVGLLAINLVGLPHRVSSISSSEAKRDTVTKALEEKSATYSNERKENKLDNGLNEFVHNNALSLVMAMDDESKNELQMLLEAKADAVEIEDFDKAKAIKTIENELRHLGVHLRKLEGLKAEAVRAEDYDYAKEVKNQMILLRATMDKRIEAMRLPQFRNYIFSYMKENRSANTSMVDDETVGDRMPTNSPNQEAPMSTRRSLVNSSYDDSTQHERDLLDDSVEVDLTSGADSKSPRSSPRYDERSFKSNDHYGVTGHEGAYLVPTDDSQQENDGPHPLAGVPNYDELPVPDELSPASEDTATAFNITTVLGEYRTRCLFSKQFSLREAVIMKIRLMLQTDDEELPRLKSCFAELVNVLRVTTDDKLHQVHNRSVCLLQDLLRSAVAHDVSSSVIASNLNPVLNSYIDKLANGNARMREAAAQGINCFVSSNHFGPASVASVALRPLQRDLVAHNVWRPLVARLHLLRDLVANFGLGKKSGLHAEAIMDFPATNQCFMHSHGEVRDAAKDLTVAIESFVGEDFLQKYLNILRPKQLDDYRAAFAASAEKGESKEGKFGNMRKMGKMSALTPRLHTKHVQHTAGKVETAAARVGEHTDSPRNGKGADFTQCMFCGVTDENWTEDSLDLHYWKDCPMLCPCPACAQVVEIAGITDHLLDECDNQDQYAQDDKTGLAIPINELSTFQESDKCRPLTAHSFYCPLCYDVCDDTDEAWRGHLLYACKSNARSYNRR